MRPFILGGNTAEWSINPPVAPPPDPDPDPGGGGAGRPTGVHDATAKAIQQYVYGWGSHCATGNLAQWRENSTLPGRLVCKYGGPFRTAGGGAAPITDALAYLNEHPQNRLRWGWHCFVGQELQRPGTPYAADRDTMNAVAAGTYDATLNAYFDRWLALPDADLARVIWTLNGHERGPFFRNGPTRDNSLDLVMDAQLAAADRACSRHVRETWNTRAGARAGLVTWEFNMWGANIGRQQDYFAACWPGNTYIDNITFDKYANDAQMVNHLNIILNFVDQFAATRGNQPRGNAEFCVKQGWGNPTKAPDFADRQVMQIEFMTRLDTWSWGHFINNRFSGNLFFEKTKGELVGPDVRCSSGEGEDMTLWMPRAFNANYGNPWNDPVSPGTRYMPMGTGVTPNTPDRTNWTATNAGYRGTAPLRTWPSNYRDVANATIPLIKQARVIPA